MADLIELALTDIKVGVVGTVYFDRCTSGQGGTVSAINLDGSVEVTNGGRTVTIQSPDGMVLKSREDAQEKATDKGWSDYEAHKDRQLEFEFEDLDLAYSIGWSNAVRYGDRDRDSIARYADSDLAPAWFDPTAAGERWNDDY